MQVQRKSKAEYTEPLPDLSAKDIYDRALEHLASLSDQVDPSHSYLKRQLDAVNFRQSLMLAFLVSCPIRHRTLLAMTMSWHLVFEPHQLSVRFRTEDMKTKRAAEMPLPPCLKRYFEIYLEIHRPLLLGAKTSDALWISRRGNPIGSDTLSRVFKNHVTQLLGEKFSPHKVRYMVATMIADTVPDKADIIAGILGHTTMKTAEKYYIRASARQTSRELAALVDGRRKRRSNPSLQPRKPLKQ